MISYLKGLLVSKNLTANGCQIVVDVNNIGYSILVNKKTYKDFDHNIFLERFEVLNALYEVKPEFPQ